MSQLPDSTPGSEVQGPSGTIITAENPTGDNRIQPTAVGVVQILGGEGNDTIVPGSAEINVTIAGGAGNDSIIGAAGSNEMAGGEGDDVVRGLAGDDFIYGGKGNDQLFGGTDNDRVQGDDGDDAVDGGDGSDTLFGVDGADTIIGGDGDDLLFGNIGADLMQGGEGSDTLYGGQGNDTLQGQGGNDFLAGDKGNDRLNGGEGSDTYAFFQTGSADADTIVAFESGETIVLGGDAFSGLGGDVEDSEFTAVGTDAERSGATTPLVYVRETGQLFYEGQLVATILNNPELNTGNFEVF
ncbi:MAG: calcium-binding protein [Lyngbya sp.]|nr:calcium-binding protein [Lyngbya sp.]